MNYLGAIESYFRFFTFQGLEISIKLIVIIEIQSNFVLPLYQQIFSCNIININFDLTSSISYMPLIFLL